MSSHTDLPYVSIIVPCRNEEKGIVKCLDSIISGDYPKTRIEVFIIDGMSEDGTREIIGGYARQYEFIMLLDNPRKTAPAALNIGIRKARGALIMRMDAHTVYEKDYISKCVRYLTEWNVDNVGGVCDTLPGAKTTLAGAIALALSHPFGVGNSYFRIGAKEPRFVDTVPFGCYRREIFEKIGFFDEDLTRNQDDEFNLRLIRNGGKILLAPDIISYYYARDTLDKLWKMYYQYGYFKPLVLQKIRAVLTFRQLIPPLFVAGLIIFFLSALLLKPFRPLLVSSLALYSAVNLTSSLLIASRRGLKYMPFLPIVFSTLHAGYGLGYLKGLWDFVILRRNREGKTGAVPLTR